MTMCLSLVEVLNEALLRVKIRSPYTTYPTGQLESERVLIAYNAEQQI